MKARGGVGSGGYRNPCLTMHQPWASLLVHGIKRVEGRSWPAPITGRLWIHAASKVPDPETIKAMEDFYREIYAVDGITDIKFPEHYPVSRLIGCVDIVGCLKCEELVCWEAVPESLRLEGLTDYCWLCEQPQKLTIPFEMRGYQKVYNLEKRIYDAAVRGLRPVAGPQPVKFLLPDPHDPTSLRPGSLASYHSGSKISAVEKPSSINAAIAGARAAATQFSKKDQTRTTFHNRDDESVGTSHYQPSEEKGNLSQFSNPPNHEDQGLEYVDRLPRPESSSSDERCYINLCDGSEGNSQDYSAVENKTSFDFANGWRSQNEHSSNRVDEQSHPQRGGSGSGQSLTSGRGLRQQSGLASSKLFAEALKGLTLN